MNHLPAVEANQNAPIHTGSNQFSTWLTVSEAVTYCSMKGLNRTPKTIRKWALRSHQDRENAELEVRREDIETGFRWSIERSTLDRKIIQEIEFEKRNQDALVSFPLIVGPVKLTFFSKYGEFFDGPEALFRRRHLEVAA